jgi:hypothetical protein
METLSIVVVVDVREDFSVSISGVNEASVLKHFDFEGAHKGLCPGVVLEGGAG